jgi:hypothetical protein
VCKYPIYYFFRKLMLRGRSQGNHPACDTAFFVPDDNQVQVQWVLLDESSVPEVLIAKFHRCDAQDVNLLMIFCGEGSASTTKALLSGPITTGAGTSKSAHSSSISGATTTLSKIISAAAPSSVASTSPATTGISVAVNRKVCRERVSQAQTQIYQRREHRRRLHH